MVEQILVEAVKSALPMIGVSGIGGFCKGFAIKKAMKIVAVVAGLLITFIGFLEYKGMISVNWDTVGRESYNMANQTLQTIVQVTQHVSDKVDNSGLMIGTGMSFMAAFLLGLKMG